MKAHWKNIPRAIRSRLPRADWLYRSKIMMKRNACSSLRINATRPTPRLPITWELPKKIWITHAMRKLLTRLLTARPICVRRLRSSWAELTAREGNLQDAASYLKVAVPLSRRIFVRRRSWKQYCARWARTLKQTVWQTSDSADPVSDFLKEDTGKPDLQHLAADPYRVLRVAAEYMRLGLYHKALDVLDRAYLSVAADQSEPGSVLPQNHPLVRYYSAYCKQKLGSDAPQNWQVANLSPNLSFSIVRDRQDCFASRTCGE